LPAARARLCVHAEDPLGQARLQTANLLPKDCADGDTSLTGVDWFQAYTLLAVLGERVGGDPLLFRLPFGCELVLAAYARSEHPAANGAAAAGGRVAIAPFRAAANGSPEPPSAAASLAAGDFVPSASDVPFVGLDFGVREWVFDLPAVPGAEMLVREWIGDHDEHLESVRALAAGRPTPDDGLFAGYQARLVRLLRERQEADGGFPFPPGYAQGRVAMGRGYATALAILALNVDRGFLPLDGIVGGR
jgi:hypothetical protein